MRMIFLFFVLLAFTGCVFSWKPSISGSSVSVTDSTSMEVHDDEKE